MKKHIPNALTLLNLFCGSIAVIFAVNDQFVYAAFFVFLGIFFDFFDGFAARKLKVSSELGLQLDSLADMVTSGLVPGIVMYKLLELSLPAWGDLETVAQESLEVSDLEFNMIFPFFGLLITLGSAYRLAKFNIDDEQQSFFKGLPTPANAILILGLPLILEFQNSDFIQSVILNTWFLVGMTLLSCYVLNANIKLFALKFKDFRFKGNVIRYIFLIMSVVFVMVLKFIAIPAIILFYILLSVIDNSTSK
ncbi:CDP-alcohol phosphatidyltransferase family protein [Tamlana sp. s12]|uniref:CDP-alcohol phosphatidyltransferase family protein n=1 Tax=Tamlana sp. s12 TaxID=1630406 RepID=UPI0007FD3DD4|nr:CDP-alcohol phosphatidyltransferase family protein [Tamlana sp. s12]OBQ55373.1 phosphatidylserine synthase [Tamlana sp. s12]QQY80948.1 CDP-alcohol phosphatidyltransferase family protein [Tamlana sp. s12]